MRPRELFFALLFLVLSWKAFGKPLRVYGRVADFNLIERNGASFSLSHLSGKVWIGDFIYTRCTDECPLLSARIKRLAKALESSSDIAFVSFSVDPRNDTPHVLEAYAQRYGAKKGQWYFLTGNGKIILALARKSFHLPVETAPEGSQIMGHSNFFVLVDQTGNIRGYYDSSRPEMLVSLKEDALSLSKRKN